MAYAIQIDTRQKAGKHDAKELFFASVSGLKTVRTKAVVGDYCLCPPVSVDTKRDVLELAQDIEHEHERFREECKLAQELGIQLYILVENTDGIETLGDLGAWRNPRRFVNAKLGKRPPIDGKRLQKACFTMQKRYGVRFLFCTPGEAGARILDLLGVPHE